MMATQPHQTKKLVVLSSDVQSTGRVDEQDSFIQTAAVAEMSTRLGYSTSIVPFTPDLCESERLPESLKCDLVVNLVESVHGCGRLSYLAPAQLDHWSLPYTGCSTASLKLNGNKLLTKKRLRELRLPTPNWVSGFQLPDIPPFSGPWIVKSNEEHASFGMDAMSVASNWVHVLKVVTSKAERYGGAWLVEQYINGREISISMLGENSAPVVLPAAELQFIDYPAEKPRIIDYAAKWNEDSFEYSHTKRSFNHSGHNLAFY